MDYKANQSQIYKNNCSLMTSHVDEAKYILNKRKSIKCNDRDDENDKYTDQDLYRTSLHRLSKRLKIFCPKEYKSFAKINNLTTYKNNSLSSQSNMNDISITDGNDEKGVPYVKKTSLANKFVFKKHLLNKQSKEKREMSSLAIPSLTNSINDTDMDTDDISPKFIFDIFSNPSSKDSQSIDSLQLRYNYECFQFNCNNLINNIPTSLDYNVDVEVNSKNYYSCFKQGKKYFNNVKPLSYNSKGNPPINLEYDEMLDDLPNYSDFTELELSLLQKISCGCKSLTWDEYQKMHLIHKSDADEFNSLENRQKYLNTEVNDSLNCTDNQRKYLIKDFKFHYHPGETNTCSVYIEDESCVLEKENNAPQEEDPLHLSFPNIEMIDASSSTVSYKNLVKGSDSTEEVIPENIEVLPFLKSEIETLKSRLNSFRLNQTPDFDSFGDICNDLPVGNEEPILQAQTISEAEFSACEMGATSDDCNSNNFVMDILSKAIHKELLGGEFYIQVETQKSKKSVGTSSIPLIKRNSCLADNETMNSNNLSSKVSSPSLERNISSDLSDVLSFISRISSFISSDETNNCSKQTKNSVGCSQNIPNFESLSLDESVAKPFIGKVLSNDDIILLSQFQNGNKSTINNNDNIITKIRHKVPVNSEVSLSLNEVCDSISKTNIMGNKISVCKLSDSSTGISSSFSIPSASELMISQAKPWLASAINFNKSQEPIKLPNINPILDSMSSQTPSALSSSVPSSLPTLNSLTLEQSEERVIDDILTHLLNKPSDLSSLEDLYYKVYETNDNLEPS